jgi:microcystin-dependent protein
MALPFYNWSRTAASNATADSTVNWAEGQAPSSVNDSGRAMMASTAAFRDDISGAIVTAGTSTAYTVSSYQVFDTLAHMSGQMIAFTPHTTSGATVTLNVDGLGAKALRSAPNTELLAGTLIQGTPYVATYNNSDAAWYLQNFYGNPYNVPLGAMIDYTATTAPNSSFIIPIGQAISRTTYAAYFALVGTTFGSGDGSTTFNVLDMRGRVAAMIDATGTILNGTYFSNSGTIGTTGGADHVTLLNANLPPYTPTGSLSLNAGTLAGSVTAVYNQNGSGVGGGGSFGPNTALSVTISGAPAGTFTGTAQGGTSTGVKTLPPMIVLNKILRVI